jgi:hypothetical protein
MFGSYSIPLKIEDEEISISLEKADNGFVYRRLCMDEVVEKYLLAEGGKLLINPIEPVNLPKELSPYLLIAFEDTLIVEPMVKRKIYLKFPIEIGVFIRERSGRHVIDILTLTKQKFTLYGEVVSGMICRYWGSGIYASLPPIDHIREGVIELDVTNTTDEWIEVRKAVFNAYGMKIYYGDEMVSMKANMRLLSGNIAETDFSNSPLLKGMSKSSEYYTSRKIPGVSMKFVMESGL